MLAVGRVSDRILERVARPPPGRPARGNTARTMDMILPDIPDYHFTSQIILVNLETATTSIKPQPDKDIAKKQLRAPRSCDPISP
ncbi:hypothetical protein JYU34_007502 [Plutella xylostella]|uniref:Uncharacterized protein n=1 Tax=Plutella xylostella TaxID=51655 RepID=A0ABQ7QQL4_PLUXY|nr:hypothetical protein JYU34_007502 [Plutella xylostella]